MLVRISIAAIILFSTNALYAQGFLPKDEEPAIERPVPSGPVEEKPIVAEKTKTIDVVMKAADVKALTDDQIRAQFTVRGIQQALTQELTDKNIDSDAFWKKVEGRKLTDAQEIELFRPLFITMDVHVSSTVVNIAPAPADPFRRAKFIYEIDSEKTKKLTDEMMSDLPDVTLKTFYILPDISIDSDMSWADVGVARAENFSGVIAESWKKWAAQFKTYGENIVVLEKDLRERPAGLNSESVTLKWTSTLKRPEVYQDRKSARFELSAQYVLVNTKSGEVISSFDFPTQKREFNIATPKALSSNLASLVYNLLNSQTTKISSALEMNKASGTLSVVEIKVTGKQGLLEISQINAYLSERYKQFALTSVTKSYSSEASVISIKSTLNSENLHATLAKDGGKFPFSEQKVLVFDSQTNTFAIIAN